MGSPPPRWPGKEEKPSSTDQRAAVLIEHRCAPTTNTTSYQCQPSTVCAESTDFEDDDCFHLAHSRPNGPQRRLPSSRLLLLHLVHLSDTLSYQCNGQQWRPNRNTDTPLAVIRPDWLPFTACLLSWQRKLRQQEQVLSTAIWKWDWLTEHTQTHTNTRTMNKWWAMTSHHGALGDEQQSKWASSLGKDVATFN